MVQKLKKMLAVLALIGLAMMFTSCKALIGNGEITSLYTVSNIVIAVCVIALDMFIDSHIKAKYGDQKEWLETKSFAQISGIVEFILLALLFICRPFAFFNALILIICLGILAVDKIIKIKNANKNSKIKE